MHIYMYRLTPVNEAFRLKAYGEFSLPVLTVPLRHKNKALGVLCIDSMGGCPCAPYETVPVIGLVRFIEQIGRLLGDSASLLSIGHLFLILIDFFLSLCLSGWSVWKPMV
jgi:hypothetical protein